MFNRWFLSAVMVAAVGGLALVIYLDSGKDAAEDEYAAPSNHGMVGTSAETAGNKQDKTSISLTAADQQRVTYIMAVLDTLSLPRARLPYYGELILMHTAAGIYSEAASWAERRAHQTNSLPDYIHAGSLYFSAVQQKNDHMRIKESANMAKEMYIKALELQPDDPDILTDLAVVYMSLLQPDRSYLMLEKALRADPDHLRANFNTGVLLHYIGNPRESIPFFDRSLDLAENTDFEMVVQEYLDRHHHDFYH